MLFELYYVSFGQMIASFSPNPLLASLLVPVFFTFVVAFCGVLVPFAGLPTFWHFMYYLSPFRYLVEALLGPVLHNQTVTCTANEFARFNAPSGQSCAAYAGAYLQQAGGYLDNPGAIGEVCRYCRYRVGDDFNATFNIFYSLRWRDFGIFCGYIIFNYIVIFLSCYLYLKGGRKIAKHLPAINLKKFIPKRAKGEEHGGARVRGET